MVNIVIPKLFSRSNSKNATTMHMITLQDYIQYVTKQVVKDFGNRLHCRGGHSSRKPSEGCWTGHGRCVSIVTMSSG